jgi:ectoine hydroxylase-related dioxygenase (phytanoyl-CoA dioxygenase family)
MIKRFKPAYWLYNLFQKEKLRHNLPLFKKYGLQKTYFSSISSQDFEQLEGKPNKYDVIDTAEHLPEEPGFSTISEHYQQALKGWSKNGYAILENFLSSERVATINAEVERLIDDKHVNFRYGGKKIMFAFHVSPLIRSIGEDEELQQILSLLMGKEMSLFQSINFIKGSEQRTHSDTIHMTTFPLGNMLAVWVALEDISEDNGPLHYYPGSHQLPYILNKDFGNEGSTLFLGNKTYADYEDKIEAIIQEQQLEKKTFLAKKGDIFIWHANLLHGGNPMNDPNLTRKSMVFHYYSNDAICYHEITQRSSFR